MYKGREMAARNNGLFLCYVPHSGIGTPDLPQTATAPDFSTQILRYPSRKDPGELKSQHCFSQLRAETEKQKLISESKVGEGTC